MSFQTSAMKIDPALQSPAENYKLLTNLVVPRPIAWITSRSTAGVTNLAPFSFFNAVSGDPLYLIVSIGLNDDGGLKDTTRNILATGEFVVNLVTEDLFAAMNLSAADFPPDMSELDIAGLHAEPSATIAVPRVAEALASLECRLHSSQTLGSNTLIIGEVVMFQVADHLLGPGTRISNFTPVGRLGSPSVYCRTTDHFDVPRTSYTQWLKAKLPAN